MAKVVLTVEGDPSEIPQALRNLLGMLGEVEQAPPAPEAETTEWTPEEVRRLWRRLARDARRILKELATRPEGYPAQDLARALGLTSTRQVGGRLASVGHRLRRFPGKPHPVLHERTPQGLVYRLRPEVARVVAELEP